MVGAGGGGCIELKRRWLICSKLIEIQNYIFFVFRVMLNKNKSLLACGSRISSSKPSEEKFYSEIKEIYYIETLYKTVTWDKSTFEIFGLCMLQLYDVFI